MRRPLVIILCFALALAAVVCVAVARYREPAVELGHKRHQTAEILLQQIRACRPGAQPSVFWMGDSTFWPAKVQMYPQQIAAETDGFLDHCIVHTPGLDYFNFYTMTAPALRSEPDLVVTIANLRMFSPSRDDVVFRDLMPELPAAELPRTTYLPLYARDLTLPRMLLDRAVATGGLRRGYLLLEGLRALFQESGRWELVGPREPAFSAEQRGRRTFRHLLEAYDQELTESQPVVRMMGETVALARRGGARSLVIVVPIPHEQLAKEGLYDPLVVWRRVRALRRTVTRNGGCLIDLHAALAPDEFADLAGHYSPRGALHLAQVVKPIVVNMLIPGNRTCPAL